MNTIFTYILLVAVLTAQMLGTPAIARGSCADGKCQCSVELKSTDGCCCSSSNATSCCQREAQDAEVRICNCGCNDHTPASPASSENRSTESLLRAIDFATESIDTAIREAAKPRPLNQNNHLFCGGVSAQLAFCLWLI